MGRAFLLPVTYLKNNNLTKKAAALAAAFFLIQNSPKALKGYELSIFSW
jgi:hypothetical protein